MSAIMQIATLVDALVTRGDAYINYLIGLGGTRDPSAATRAAVRGLGLTDPELDALYIEDDMAAKVVELVVKHGLRKGWDLAVPGDPEKAAEARTAYALAEEELGVAGAIWTGATWGRLRGGALTWIGVDDGKGFGDAAWVERQAQPLDMDAIERVLFLHAFDRRQASVWSNGGDPLQPSYRKPDVYQISAPPTGPRWNHESPLVAMALTAPVKVHVSRLLVWPGAPTDWYRQMQRSWWDDSVLERAWGPLRAAGEDFGSKSMLLGRVSQFVFKLKGLGAMIVADERKLNRRMSLLDGQRSRGRALVLDTEESAENITQPITGIDSAVDKSVDRVATSGDIPPSVFGGRATQAERETWDEEVESWQSNVLRPRHERLAEIVMRSKKGPFAGKEPDGRWSIVYRPLRTPQPKERAELRKLRAETDAIEVDKGIIPPEAVALHRHTTLASGEGEVPLDEAEVKAALLRRRELANKPPKDNAELGTVSARAGGGVLEVLVKYNSGAITRAQAKKVLLSLFTMTDSDAEEQLDKVEEVAKIAALAAAAAAAAANGPKGTPRPQGAGAPQGLPGYDDGGDPKSKTLPPEPAK